jgi:hypothetical protein
MPTRGVKETRKVDLDVTGLGKIGEQLIKSVDAFVSRLLGPLADEKGRQWAERSRVKYERTRNWVQVVNKTEDLVGDLEINPVPLRLLGPIADAASNESDPEMQTLWAKLLANAATKSSLSVVLPSFPRILQDLTPEHVAVLDWMYGDYVQHPDLPDVNMHQILHKFAFSDEDYHLLVADLHRLQLIDGRRIIENGLVDEDDDTPRYTSESRYETIGLTSLGKRFIRACTVPPRKT